MDADEIAELTGDGSQGGTRFTVRRPTKPGWYWLNQGAESQVVLVSSAAGFLTVHVMGGLTCRLVDVVGGKWLGPIEEPK